MTSLWPKFITFKHVFAQSVRSRIDPTQLTATDKLTFARARIWHEVLGGNLKTRLSMMKKPLDGQARVKHFDYVFRDFYLPYVTPRDEYFFQLEDAQALRVLRQGKVKVHEPSRTKHHVPKYELKRYLHMIEKRKKLAAENFVQSPMQALRKKKNKDEVSTDRELLKSLQKDVDVEEVFDLPKRPEKKFGTPPKPKAEEKPKTDNTPKAEDKPQTSKEGKK